MTRPPSWRSRCCELRDKKGGDAEIAVYGTGIPKLEVRYSLADSPKGVLWKTQITQRGVPPSFRTMLPFVLRAKAGVMSGKLFTNGEVTNVEIELPSRPESVEYNPFHATLCELEVKK